MSNRVEVGRLPAIAALVGAAAGLALTLALPAGVFSGDEGVKLAQSQALVHHGWRDLALPYLGADADPEGRYFPISPPFAWQRDGAWYGIYSFEYTAVGAVFWRLGGLSGVFLLSWLGAALALWALARLASRALEPPWAAGVVLAAAAGTPLLLYGTTNYEHAWACALVFFCLDRLAVPAPTAGRLAAAGALLGLAVTLRPELFAFPVAVAGFAFVFWGPGWPALRRLTIVGAATAAVAGLHLLLNRFFFGSFHPNLDASDHPLTTWEHSLGKLAAPEAGDGALLALLLALAVGLAPGRTAALRLARAAGALVVTGLLVVAVWRAASQVSPEITSISRTLIGLFTATPLAIVGVLRGPRPRRPRGDLGAALALGAILFVAVVTAIRLPGFWGGLEMGSRYLLPAAPLLILAAAEGIRRADRGPFRAATAAAAVVLLIASATATVLNAGSLRAIRARSRDLTTAVGGTEIDDVVIGKPWAALLLAPVFLDKRIYARADGRLYQALHELGRRRLLAVETGMTDGTAGRIELTLERWVSDGVLAFSLATDPMGEWITEHVASGASILREDGTPALDPALHRIEHRAALGRLSPEVLRRGEWDYVLVAETTYGRFVAGEAGSEERARIARRYEEMLAWPLAAEFSPRGSRLALYRVPGDDGEGRTRRRWRASDASWASDETILPADPADPIRFTRRWQVAAFRGRFAPGRYEIRLANQPPRVEAYLHVVTPDNREVGSFRVGRKIEVELPRRDTYLLRVFQAPPSALSAVTIRPLAGR